MGAIEISKPSDSTSRELHHRYSFTFSFTAVGLMQELLLFMVYLTMLSVVQRQMSDE
jgi:hypothetical protein